MKKYTPFFLAFLFLFGGAFLGQTLFSNHTLGEKTFSFGLDLVGGSHLVYEADTKNLEPQEINEAMSALRSVIERRINVFGVSEPLIQVERASFLSGSENKERLIIELPGVTDLDEAVKMIGATPELEFKLVSFEEGEMVYTDTGLTGRYLSRAQVVFAQSEIGMNQGPIVQAVFTQEGRELFADITRNNVGRQLAIFLDGDLKSAPNIIEPILGGTAQITGNFTLEEAKELVRNLNIGALPVPISLASTETIGASLGSAVLEKGVFAFLIGLSLVFFFMLLWYRALGFIANIALTLYGIIMLSLFMYIPVTLTAAGIAGFILSIGMAVDANVLIFERLKEVLKKEESDFTLAIKKAFSEAWPAIRDGNGTSLISALVLFWLGTGMVQGFALVFGIGVVVSMISALLITRIFLLASAPLYRKVPFLFKSGFLDK